MPTGGGRARGGLGLGLLGRGEAAHAFRHSYAIGQIDNGTAVHELQDVLGHAFLDITAIYLRASADGLGHTAAAAPIAGLLPAGDEAPPGNAGPG